MSLKDFKESLHSCSSSSSHLLVAAAAKIHGPRKPPKSNLKQQLASIHRLAADLNCTPSGSPALPVSSNVSPKSAGFAEGGSPCHHCGPFERPVASCDGCSPYCDDGFFDENCSDLDCLQPLAKRTKLNGCHGGGDLQTQFGRDGFEILPVRGVAMRHATRSGSGRYGQDAERENSKETASNRRRPLSNVASRGSSSFKGAVSDFLINHCNTKRDEGGDMDSDLDEEGLAIRRADSEAGLFIRSEMEGPFEPLILWSPKGEGSHQDSENAQIVQVPASINSRLLEHQREGIRFLYKLYRENRGGVLGDDMGLGKTIQTIAFLAAILQKSDFEHGLDGHIMKAIPQNPVLIICPTSVIRNWDHEFQAWSTFNVAIYHGIQRELVISKLDSKDLEIVLTSFDTFRIYGECLCEISWECVIVDEAHRLKNEKSQLYKMCVKIPTKRRYGLTGTIMQNKFMDLFHVFDWVAPGCLGNREHFREFYDEPLKQGQRISAPERFVCIAEERKLHLSKVLQRHLLRRTKQETIGHMMMGKEDNVVFCAMSPLQQRVYRRLLDSPDFQCLIKKDLPCSCGSPLTHAECCYRTIPDGIIWSYMHREYPDGCDSCPYCLVLPCLTKLQQVSNHLELIKPNPKDDPDKQKKDEALAALVFGEDVSDVGGTRQDESFLSLSDAEHCGKMRALETLLVHWTTQGDKVLLFSYSVRMLDILDKFLIRKGYCFSRLDGSTPFSSRQPMVDDFNSSPSKQVFLISTRAGGLGLNLVSANRVVIFDPNWNPAQDLQAQDRSFRYGQRRHVTVFRLLAAGSLEELVYTRQIYKQQLFNIAVSGNQEKRYFEGVQDSKENKGELFGISNLFRDLSSSGFINEIIESHEKRLLNLTQGRGPIVGNEKHELENLEKIKKTGAGSDSQVGVQTYQGFVKITEECTTKGSGKDMKCLPVELSHMLSNAGVIYAHRNEDVVNLKENASERVANCVRNGNKWKQLPFESSCKLQTDGAKEVAIQPVSMQNILRTSKAGDLRAFTGKSKLLTDRKATTETTVVSQKGQQFTELAKFKKMEETSFSRWLLSVSDIERQRLLDDYKNWQKNIAINT
eukprot:c28741_g1_i1 orf=351-3611(-)